MNGIVAIFVSQILKLFSQITREKETKIPQGRNFVLGVEREKKKNKEEKMRNRLSDLRYELWKAVTYENETATKQITELIDELESEIEKE